jgi:PKD repeat protein
VTVVVANRLPVADAGPNATGNKNELLTLHGSGTDADGDPLTYDWSQTAGPDANLTQTTKTFLSFMPQKAGNYTFRLVVNDGEQDSAPSQVAVKIEARPPEAVISANATLTYLKTDVEFSAEKSTDVDGTIVRYIFDFGDGTDSGWTIMPLVNHSYSRPGVFNATVKVRDEDGLVSSVSVPVKLTVRNRPPVVKGMVTPLEGNTSTLFRFSMPSGSTYDPDGTIVSYVWEFGDGASTNTSPASHVYKKTGEYDAVLRVTDEFGEDSEAHFTINVQNRAPELLTSAPAPACFMMLGNEQLFTVTARDPDGDMLEYQWFIDGQRQPSNESSLIYKPSRKGQHAVNLTVSDGGLSVWAGWNVSVLARTPPGTQNAGPDIFLIIGAVIILSVCAGVVAAFVLRDRKGAPFFGPGRSAPPVEGDVPMALPEAESLPSPGGEGPKEALPVEEPPGGPQDQLPPDPWKPVQEPYSKQLWNK